MFTPKIIALDLDGTLFARNGTITPFTKEQIKAATGKGITVVLSTGRPYAGLPIEEAKALGISYAITANGAGIYQIEGNRCLYEEGMPPQTAARLLAKLYQMHLHLDAFINGDAYAQPSTLPLVSKCTFPDSVKKYILTSRIRIDDLPAYIIEHQLTLQKSTLNFEPDTDGSFIDREKTKAFLLSQSDIQTVSGGYNNLEFTKKGVTKAKGLQFLCDHLQIPIEASMVCGDSENDADILKAAGFAVAMENATNSIKSICDYVTSSCDDDGVGHAIAKVI